MKKNSTRQQSSKLSKKLTQGSITIGMDLGDKTSRYCILNSQGEVAKEAKVATTRKAMTEEFGKMARCRIAIEVGTHSRWVGQLLSQQGHEVIVANAREVKAISGSSRKDDRVDAQTLARLARVDPTLLHPIRHRSEQAHGHLMKIRVRSSLVEARTALINAARGLVKAVGERLAKCGADQMGTQQLQGLPESVQATLKPLLEQVESLTKKIKECDTEIEQIARTEYPETDLLKQVSGVGNLIALTFVLTVDDPERFRKSRDVGCYSGLRPERKESGERKPELGISKEGDSYLRKMLVQAAHHILGHQGPDTDLKRWGLRLAARGGKNAKKRAIVAVARKLAVLLHRLWVTGEVYEPLRNSQVQEALKQRAA
jgi:transposase